VSMIQRVTLAGACLPSELAEESGEVRWELWELLGRELAGDDASERRDIFQQTERMSGGQAHENEGSQQTYRPESKRECSGARHSSRE
jgi:hypothetical protein